LQKFEDFRGLNVDDVMTKNPIKIQPNLFLGEALSLMTNRESQIGVLPVVAADNKCIGVIRVHDIVRSGI
jgi:arabinose-5-phosphate isomerase